MATVQDLTTQLEQAKIDEKAAQVAAVEQQKTRARELAEVERHATNELNGLRTLADKVFTTKPTPTGRPSPDIRSLSRQFLHAGIDNFEINRLATDPMFGSFFGMSRRAGQLLIRFVDIGVADDALFAAADAIEARGWKLAVERARELAGES
jgi:hypothetical protein